MVENYVSYRSLSEIPLLAFAVAVTRASCRPI